MEKIPLVLAKVTTANRWASRGTRAVSVSGQGNQREVYHRAPFGTHPAQDELIIHPVPAHSACNKPLQHEIEEGPMELAIIDIHQLGWYALVCPVRIRVQVEGRGVWWPTILEM